MILPVPAELISQMAIDLKAHLARRGWLSPKHKYIALQELAGQAMIGLQQHDLLLEKTTRQDQEIRTCKP